MLRKLLEWPLNLETSLGMSVQYLRVIIIVQNLVWDSS